MSVLLIFWSYCLCLSRSIMIALTHETSRSYDPKTEVFYDFLVFF